MKRQSNGRLAAWWNRQHRILYLLLSFLVPFILIVLALIALHITPFGDHNLAIVDAKFYLNDRLWLGRLLRGQENILYSMNRGLGSNTWSQTAWGGFDFGSLLSAFATLETMPTIFTWICAVNLSVCGLTMYIMLDGVNGHKGSNLIFSTSYALMGFNVVNCYQTFFLTGPAMLPLVMLGLARMFKGKRPYLYIFSLAFCAFFSFYFAFHLCVLSLICFIVYLCVHRREFKGRRARFTLSWLVPSAIGGLLAAPMWLPALKALSGGDGRLDQTVFLEYHFRENMPFIQIFSKLFSGANSTNELVTGLPNIFCGILVVALVILYFIDGGNDARRKRAAGIVLAFYLLTFYLHALTLVMHGGTHTNWFPYRYSYVFSFLLICLAAEEFRHLDALPTEAFKRCGVVLLIAALIVFSTSYEFITGGAVVLDFALLLIMWLGVWFYRTRPDKATPRTLSMLLLILVGVNLYVNFIISTANVKSWELDLSQYNENVMVSGTLVDALNLSEEDFFRMEKDESESDSVGKDPELYNYNGVSHSGPTERMFIHQGLCKLGVNWYDMRHWYAAGAPAATDSLLGLKYVISKRDLAQEKDYAQKVSLMGTNVWLNPNALSVAILADGAAQTVEPGDDVFENLNAVWKAMTGEDRDIFTEQDEVTYALFNDYSNQTVTSTQLRESAAASEESASESGGSTSEGGDGGDEDSNTYVQYTFVARQDGPVYVFDTSIPGSESGLAKPAMRYVGTYSAGDTVEGKFPLSGGISSGEIMRGYCVNQVFAYADNALLAEYARKLNDRDVTFNVVHENDLTGEFTAAVGQRLLFTLPWDEGWRCTIDGQEIPIDRTWDLFMSVELPEGSHTYEMKFIPAWMDYGLYLAALALAGLIAYMIAWRKRLRIK